MTTNAEYNTKLAAAIKRSVSPEQFRAAALLSGWTARSIDLFLKPPVWKKHVLVGNEGLAIQ